MVVNNDDNKLLDQYDSGRMNQMNRQDELVYSRGLMDGIMFCYWVERVGRGEEKIVV